jgi:nucleotide-binding universal stress UspA family protein
MRSFKKILVPTDFSTGSKRALEMAVEVATRFEASIDVIHVVELPIYMIPDMTVAVPGTAALDFGSFARGQAEREMQLFLRNYGPPPESRVKITQVIDRGEPTRMILDHAEDGGYDLIVMGTHGRTGLDHLLLGSTAERVIRRASCPVLTIRDPAKKA